MTDQIIGFSILMSLLVWALYEANKHSPLRVWWDTLVDTFKAFWKPIMFVFFLIVALLLMAPK